jgi:hypothetical protein
MREPLGSAEFWMPTDRQTRTRSEEVVLKPLLCWAAVLAPWVSLPWLPLAIDPHCVTSSIQNEIWWVGVASLSLFVWRAAYAVVPPGWFLASLVLAVPLIGLASCAVLLGSCYVINDAQGGRDMVMEEIHRTSSHDRSVVTYSYSLGGFDSEHTLIREERRLPFGLLWVREISRH